MCGGVCVYIYGACACMCVHACICVCMHVLLYEYVYVCFVVVCVCVCVCCICTRKLKSGEKWGRPGKINDVRWMQGDMSAITGEEHIVNSASPRWFHHPVS